MKLCGRLVKVADISAHHRDAMLQLMERHYCNTTPASFEADLAEKQWIIEILHQSTGELCGFSTQMVLDAVVHDRQIKALFSGDTIIDRRHWGDRTLMQVGGQLSLSLIDKWPEAELYWFLISQGYKTYRFLPVFFREFYPRYDVPMPDSIRHVIDALARQKYPRHYDAIAGIVRSHAQQYRLREGVADATPGRCRDPHVQYFVERNPGHVVGDELCCVARLSRGNFTDAACRILSSSS